MATSDFNAENPLAGAYAFIGVSDDLSVTDPTIDWIAYRSDEINLSQDWENAEWSFPEQVGMVRQRLHNARDLEFSLAAHVGMSQLKDIGIVDSNDVLKDTVTKDVRIKVFKNSVDDVDTATADLIVDCYSTELTTGELNLAQDGGSASMPAYINGKIEIYENNA
jgi:hypothetical protein